MGYAKNGTGGSMYIRNGEKHLAFSDANISPATFVKIVNNGGGELLLSSMTGKYYAQVSMAGIDKIVTLEYASEYPVLTVGKITDDGITFGTGVTVYMPEGKCGFFVMSGGTKIVTFFIASSGYSNFSMYSISGITLTMAVNLGDATDFVGPSYYDVCKISDTQLISWASGYSGGEKTNLYVLTISGDTFTKSSVFTLWDFNADPMAEHYDTVYLHGCVISDGKVVLLERGSYDTTPLTREVVHLLNLSGDTLSLVSSTEIDTTSSWVHQSEMIKITDGSAVIMTEIGSSSTISLTMLTLSGNALTVKSLDTGVIYQGIDYILVNKVCYGYELAVKYPYVYMLCGYETFTLRTYIVEGDSLTFVSEKVAYLDGKLLTYTRGNAQFAEDKTPVVAIGHNDGSSSLWATYLTAGKIYNVGRLEVTEAKSTIDGVSITSLSTKKAGKIWMLKNDVVTIIFAIDGVAYRAESGMTWAEWVDSDYNTEGFFLISNAVSSAFGSVTESDGITRVKATDVINSGMAYGLYA